jgi:hypothetical protein
MVCGDGGFPRGAGTALGAFRELGANGEGPIAEEAVVVVGGAVGVGVTTVAGADGGGVRARDEGRGMCRDF